MTQIQQQTRKLPDFSTMSREEEAEWWDTHEVTDYLDELKPVDIEFQLEKPKEDNIVVRLQRPVKVRLEQIARHKGLNISSLTRMWIMEKIQSTH
jgi:predicted DNA binding CopG/RHH family protein